MTSIRPPEVMPVRVVVEPDKLVIGKRVYRKLRAVQGWPNWYINRGRLPLNPTKADLRRLSWRRVK